MTHKKYIHKNFSFTLTLNIIKNVCHNFKDQELINLYKVFYVM